MKVITLTNEKGGVGKTTLALHIAAGLALMNKRVLLLDSDPQGHCANQLKVKEFGGLYRLLVQDEEWNKVLREPEFAQWGGPFGAVGRLLLLPSNLETRAIPLMMSNPLALRERLAELESIIDVVVIDTAPTPSLLQTVIYSASDFILFPTQCELLSLDGLAKSTLHITQQNAARASYGLDEPVRLLGVVPTMFTNTAAHAHGIDLLEKHFGAANVWKPFTQRTVWREAGFQQKTLYSYAPTHEVTMEVAEMVKKVANYA
jgi:chromosome partitioning protein